MIESPIECDSAIKMYKVYNCPKHGKVVGTIEVYGEEYRHIRGVYCHVCYMENTLKGLNKIEEAIEEKK